MATAGTSSLAGTCGLPWLVAPLLAMAIGQALWIALAATIRWRSAGGRRVWPVGAAHEQTGIHTVPLGTAVIAVGMAGFSGGGSMHSFELPSSWAIACTLLTWLLALICIIRYLRSLLMRGTPLERLDGTWFLVPATLLGATIATADVTPLAPMSTSTIMDGLAFAAAMTGWVGYVVVLVAAAIRVARFGLRGVPQSSWWISMGCAGLAAAALGRMLDTEFAWTTSVQHILALSMETAILCALALGSPITIYSVIFLVRRCRFRNAAAWTPTFSTAVFALGCLKAGEWMHLPSMRLLGLAAGYVTLGLWAITIVWNMARWTKLHLWAPTGAPDKPR